MTWRGIYVRIFGLWMVLAPWSGYSQMRGSAHAVAGVDAAGNSETVEAALHQMSDRAAVILVGTVREIHRSEGSGVGGGVVEVRIDVEQAIRGCSGSTYTVREWAGLWTANDARYRVGQRLLLLLHAPGVTGLTSPVGGMDGAIPLRASGAGIRPLDGSKAVAAEVADLRWIGAKLARTVSYRSPTAPPTAPTAARARVVGAGSSSGVQAAVAGGSDASTPAQEAALSTLVGMIRSWEVGTDATR